MYRSLSYAKTGSQDFTENVETFHLLLVFSESTLQLLISGLLGIKLNVDDFGMVVILYRYMIVGLLLSLVRMHFEQWQEINLYVCISYSSNVV